MMQIGIFSFLFLSHSRAHGRMPCIWARASTQLNLFTNNDLHFQWLVSVQKKEREGDATLLRGIIRNLIIMIKCQLIRCDWFAVVVVSKHRMRRFFSVILSVRAPNKIFIYLTCDTIQNTLAHSFIHSFRILIWRNALSIADIFTANCFANLG